MGEGKDMETENNKGLMDDILCFVCLGYDWELGESVPPPTPSFYWILLCSFSFSVLLLSFLFVSCLCLSSFCDYLLPSKACKEKEKQLRFGLLCFGVCVGGVQPETF